MGRSTRWHVWIADLKGSRTISAADRPHVDRAIGRAIRHTAERFSAQFRLEPEMLRGDELQAVLRADAPVLSALTYLRAQLAIATQRWGVLRAGVGSGAIAKLSPKGPFSSDGEAFHRARQAIDSAEESGQLTMWITGDPRFDRVARTMLALSDALVGRWTLPQWEAIAGRLEGKGLHAIGRSTRVSFQSVSKRLRAAAWTEVEASMNLLQQLALEMDEPVARRRAGVRPLGVESRISPSRG